MGGARKQPSQSDLKADLHFMIGFAERFVTQLLCCLKFSRGKPVTRSW